MWRIRMLASRLRGIFAGRRAEDELDREIEGHLALLTERFAAQGMSPADARHAARRQFGGIAQLQETHRAARGFASVENLQRDLLFSLRMIRKQPAFSIIVIAILALGVGANTAIFSLVNGILLRPLPFAHPENLVRLFERDVLGNNDSYDAVAPANYSDWRRQTATLDGIAGISYARLNLSGATESGAAERIDVCACSGNFFETLGVKPAAGRGFRPEEDQPGAPPVVVISHGLWKRRFHESTDVLSGTIKLDTRLYTVIGVMPPDFSYPARSIEAWIPLENWLPPVVMQAHDNHVLTVIGRLKPGENVTQANAEIDGMVRRYKTQHPRETMGNGATVAPLAEVEVRDARKLILLLFGAVSCVLLIACVNVANLLLSRAAGRQREAAIRVALGAARGRIIRQLLVESTLLSLLGGLGGLALCTELIHRIAAWASASSWLPQSATIRLDPAVFAFSLGVSVAAGLLAGIVPAMQTSSALNLVGNLKDGGRSSAGRPIDRFREILVAAEVALSLVLLLGAGLVIRSFGHMMSLDLGLRLSNRMTMRVSLPDARYHERSQVSAFLKQLAGELQSVPGVQDVGLTSCPAITLPGFCPDSVFQIENQPASSNRLPDAGYRGVNPEFFRAAGIPILHGRSFNLSDGIGLDDKRPGTGAAIVNQAFAKKFFPAADPVDHVILLNWFVGNNTSQSALRYRIVGVSGDVLEQPQSPAKPMFYLPLLDGDSTEISIVLNVAAGAPAVASDVRSVVRKLDPDLALFGIQSLHDSIDETTGQERFVMTLLGAFAAIAVVLAAVGLYGVVAWGVSQRTKEIAIRIALGATRGQVRTMVVTNGLRPALLGLAIGLPSAAWLTGLLQSLLVDVRPTDPITFTLVPLLLLAVTVLACVAPAIRATRVDPTVGLRVD